MRGQRVGPVFHFTAVALFTFGSASHSFADDISPGGVHVLARNALGEVFVWGGNFSGQLGLGDLNTRALPQKLPLSSKVSRVFAKRDHSCLLFDDGTVKCFGENYSGQLGLGTTEGVVGGGKATSVQQLPAVNLGSLRPERLFLGINHTCALFPEGGLKCFGANLTGELGIGSAVKSVGTDAKDMGNNLNFSNISSNRIVDGCLGRSFTCVLTDTGAVKCFGAFLAIGSGAKKNIGTKPAEMGESLKPLSLGLPAVGIACAEYSACALLSSGELKCWGKNVGGSLGIGVKDGEILGDEPGEMEKLPTVSLEPGLLVTGVACGSAHCCAILENHAIKCWGLNSSGQLGLGDRKNRGIEEKEMGKALPYVDLGDAYQVKKISLGSVSSCAELSTGGLKCWGGNQSGQLGTGASSGSIGATPSQMGNNLKAIAIPGRN